MGLEKRVKSRFSRRTISLTLIKDLPTIKEEIATMLHVSTADIKLLDPHVVAFWDEKRISEALSIYERSIPVALENYTVIRGPVFGDRSCMDLNTFSQLQVNPSDLSKVCLAAFRNMSATNSNVMKPEFISEGL